MAENKGPKEKFRAGAVTATVWENTAKKGDQEFKVYNVTIERNYKDGEKWESTNQFRMNDLPKVALVTNKAYEYIATMTKEDSEAKADE